MVLPLERYLEGVVMSPGEVDTQGEVVTSAVVRVAAYDYLTSGNALGIDVDHGYAARSGVEVVESWVNRGGVSDRWPVDAWVVRVRVTDPVLVSRIDEGSLNGFSWAGPVDRRVRLVRLEHPVEAEGETEALAGHVHRLALRFDSWARVLPAVTGESVGHVHEVRGTTRTERSGGHVHGISFRGLAPPNTPGDV